jgi:dihydroflavonol-4-reductase
MAVAVVTGATGFIGTHLVAHLRSLNWHVIALARRTSNVAVLNSLGAEVVRVDVTDRTAMLAAVPQQADVVFHLACAPFGNGFQADYIARVNEDGLRNALFAATDKKATCLVYVSDAICYGVQDSIIHDKTELAAPQNLQGAYARSRRECEAIFGRAIARGLDAVCVMPSAVLGHGLRQYRMRPFEELLDSESVHATEGGRNFVDVASFVQLLVRAAERGMTGQRYLVGGAYQSWEEILQRFVDVNGLSTKVNRISGLGQVAKIFKKLGPSSRSVDRADEWMWSLNLEISAEISESDLGFKPSEIDAALKTLYAYLRN